MDLPSTLASEHTGDVAQLTLTWHILLAWVGRLASSNSLGHSPCKSQRYQGLRYQGLRMPCTRFLSRFRWVQSNKMPCDIMPHPQLGSSSLTMSPAHNSGIKAAIQSSTACPWQPSPWQQAQLGALSGWAASPPGMSPFSATLPHLTQGVVGAQQVGVLCQVLRVQQVALHLHMQSMVSSRSSHCAACLASAAPLCR